jgi:four helix bundle protein
VEIATGSLFEVVSQTHIAKRQGYLSPEAFQEIYHRSEELSRMLSGLRRYLTDEVR